jgi:hypothetical protein
MVYVRTNPPFEPQDVGLHSPRVLGVVRRADDHPTRRCVPGGTYSRTVGRLFRWSELDLRKLIHLLNPRLEVGPQRSGHEALQQLLHEDKRDFQVVTPPAVYIRAFNRTLGTPRREIYLRELLWHCPVRADGAY